MDSVAPSFGKGRSTSEARRDGFNYTKYLGSYIMVSTAYTYVMRDIFHFKEDAELEVGVPEQGLEIKKLTTRRLVLPFSEAELLKGMTSKTAHADMIARPLKGEY